MAEPDVEPKNIVGSILKASRLLDRFSMERREITLGEFTLEAGYNKTTTYRLLQTLVAAGWLVRTPSGGYRLGMRLLVLGAIAREDLDLRSEAIPIMRQLADEFGDTSFLMVPGPHGAVIIETVVGQNPVRVHGITAGAVLPYHVAAAPVVLAAFNPDIEADVLKGERSKHTRNTLSAKGPLAARFAQVRSDGYAVSQEDFMEDVSAVAAPVFDATGRAVASLSVGGPANRFVEPVLGRAIERVVDFAADLSRRLHA